MERVQCNVWRMWHSTAKKGMPSNEWGEGGGREEDANNNDEDGMDNADEHAKTNTKEKSPIDGKEKQQQ